MTRKIAQFTSEVTNKKIYQFGVQAPPNSKIIFNGDDYNYITMGSSGIFQAELPEGSYITGIKVEPALVQNVPGIYYIDIVFEEGE